MKNKKLLDTYAVLAWLFDERGAEKVDSAIAESKNNNAELLITLINLGELYYILRRHLSKVEVHAIVDQIINVPISIIPITEQLVWSAAEIKARNPLSYADSFAIAAAQEQNATVLTGDPEFKRVEDTITIEWL